MYNEMIERVAKAIADCDDKDMGDAKIGWNECDASMREDYRTEAMAAMKAMREPTEKMMIDGADVDFHDEYRVGETIAKSVYQAMIDAVINE